MTLIIIYSVTFIILYLAGAGDIKSTEISASWAIPAIVALLSWV
jgi:hypothetical protein